MGYRPDHSDRYEMEYRHFDHYGASDRREGPEYNVSTHNNFYPLRDLDGPSENPEPRGASGISNPLPHSRFDIGEDLASPGPSNANQHWGFHKTTQGKKRPMDAKEGPGEGEGYDQKRKKS